ncbi:hypothetical protein UP99_19375 [Escherichia coli]|nr:hypothetical protein UP99_19375 [Escherichia coli]
MELMRNNIVGLFFFCLNRKTAYDVRLGLVGSELCIRVRFRMYAYQSLIQAFMGASPMAVNNARLPR